MKLRLLSLAACLLLPALGALAALSGAPEFEEAVRDRAAVEAVYHRHRTAAAGNATAPSLSEAALREMVRTDVLKEALLQKRYGIKLTTAQITAEVQRIITTTQAPEVLKELRAVLGNDDARFARTVARPLIVDRMLRMYFDGDAGLHAAARRILEEARAQVLKVPAVQAARRREVLADIGSGTALHDVAFVLEAPGNATAEAAAAQENISAGGTYQVQSSASLLTRPAPTAPGGIPPPPEPALKDLPADLQAVLNTQLRQPGDASAVIETSGAFLLYLALERTPARLRTAVLSLPKLSYDSWLAEALPDIRPGS